MKGLAAIGLRVGRVLNKYKVGKHFTLEITEKYVTFHLLKEQIAAEAALDGIYVIRTSGPKKQMSAADAVRNYKALANAERALRALMAVDLKVRPVHHHLEPSVRAHIFLCMVAYYVEWHLLEAWRPLLFADEDQVAKKLIAVRSPRSNAPRKRCRKLSLTLSLMARQRTASALSSRISSPLCATLAAPPGAR